MGTLQAKLWSFATVVISAVCLATPVGAADLTLGSWLLTSEDRRGTSWSGSTLHFLTQEQNGEDYLLSGFFEWRSNRRSFGRENFVGTLFADNRLNLNGTEIVQPAFGIGTSRYQADLEPSGTQLINGVWTTGVVGEWSAVLVSDAEPAAAVPEPGSEGILLASLLSLAAYRVRRKKSV